MAESAAEALNLPFAASDVVAEVIRWRAYLASEKRMSPKTVEAYARDTSQFLAFLAEHLGGKVTLARLVKLIPADVRAFMASRRADGIGSRSLMRGLAGMRSFTRYLEREGKGRVSALSAVRAPKIGKTLPKPISVSAAKELADVDLRAGEEREPWIFARDAAVLALLYGSGLRISEALGLKRKEVPAPGKGDAITVTGKGNKQRMVPVLAQVLVLIADYVKLCPYDLPPDGAAVRRRARRAALAAHRAAGDGAAARRARPAGDGDAACAAAFVRDASACARWRSARDPGAARPRLALDHADLYRDRRRAPDGRLPQRAPARLKYNRQIIEHEPLAAPSCGGHAVGYTLLPPNQGGFGHEPRRSRSSA